MSKKTIIIIIVILVGAYFFFQSSKTEAPKNETPVSQEEVKTSGEGAVKKTTGAPKSVVTSANDTSDAALEKDLSNIDAELNALGADASNANASLTDNPVSQAE